MTKYCIRTGVAPDLQGCDRAFVALDVKYNDDDYYYQEAERWWFGEFTPGGNRPADPAMRAKIRELMDKYFRQ